LGQVVIGRDDFLAEQPDVAARFARGLAKATLFGFSNPEGAVRLHWKMYPQSRPAGTDEAKILKDAIHVFNGRFESQRIETARTSAGARPRPPSGRSSSRSPSRRSSSRARST